MAQSKAEYWKTQEGLTLLAGWARDGLTDEQIAKNMGISRSTLSNWKIQHPDILNTLKKNKEIVDIAVENALLKRAVGYCYLETIREARVDPQTGEEKLVVTKTVTKEIAPDVTAQIYWLKNRMRDKWQDRVQREHSGGVEIAFSEDAKEWAK